MRAPNQLQNRTMEIPTDCLNFKNRDQWRNWLANHYATQTQAWLIIYKKKYQDQGLALGEAVEEALCFGWIDGTLKSRDAQTYALRFSPRMGKSIWSVSNIERAETLIRAGKMIPAGYQKIAEAQENGEWEAALRREQVDQIPEELEAALQKVDGAISAFQALPASRKKQYIYWLQSAKRADTQQKRIQKIVDEITDTI